MAGEPGRRLHARRTITVNPRRTLCGVPVTEAEFSEFMRTGVVTPRILKQHTWPKPETERTPAPWE